MENKIEKHKQICDSLNSLYKKKNEAYGDSFGETYKKLGIISAITRITDKYNRIVNLIRNAEIDDIGESIEDTLLDMANYCIMTKMELEEEYKHLP